MIIKESLKTISIISSVLILACAYGLYGIIGSIKLNDNYNVHNDCSNMWGFVLYSTIYAFLTCIALLFFCIARIIHVIYPYITLAEYVFDGLVCSQILTFGSIIWGTIIQYSSSTCQNFYEYNYVSIWNLYEIGYWGSIVSVIIFVIVLRVYAYYNSQYNGNYYVYY